MIIKRKVEREKITVSVDEIKIISRIKNSSEEENCLRRDKKDTLKHFQTLASRRNSDKFRVKRGSSNCPVSCRQLHDHWIR